MDYLQSLYRHAEGRGHLSVWSKQTKATRWFAVTELDQAGAYMIDKAAAEDLYFGWCLFGEPSTAGRGRQEDTCFSPGVFFDADLYSDTPGVHAQTNLPRSLEEVSAWLGEAGFPQPSAIRSSGNGLYLDWLHDEPVFFMSAPDRKTYAEKVKRFHASLRSSASSLRGWKFDPTHDLARVTRMPGTLNHKTNPPKPVQVLS